MIRPKWEVADVLRIAADQMANFDGLPLIVKKAALDIIQCRTSILGGHKSKCSHCDHFTISYNSCRNRHCPKCQFSKREQWIMDREAEILPVQYFHVVFTLPHVLNPMAKAFSKIIYSLIFKAAWKTIKTLGDDKKWLGAKTGMIALLHTWGQNLSLHPHLHCIIPQGGWIPELNRWVFSYHRKFLFPVRVMSALYRKFFIQGLIQAFLTGQIHWDNNDWNMLICSLKQSSFNVFTKKPFAGPLRVIQYIGRYSHRVAITNHRIIHLDNKQVNFSFKDYRDGQSKIMTLTPLEFARRFLMHVLPKGFAKIRHFGILSNKAKSIYIPDILHFFERRTPVKAKFSPREYFLKKINIDLTRCPVCKIGSLMRSAIIPQNRGDPTAFFNPVRSRNSIALQQIP
jgi:hypothetical protein